MLSRSFNGCRSLRTWLLLAGLAGTLCGCSDSGPSRAAITGKVTVGSQPLPAGRIIFTPQAPTNGPSTTVAVVNGRYHATRSQGPFVGQNLVQVEADLQLGFPLDDEQAFVAQSTLPLVQQSIPPAYNVQSQITTEVRPDALNRCDVAIPAAVQPTRN